MKNVFQISAKNSLCLILMFVTYNFSAQEANKTNTKQNYTIKGIVVEKDFPLENVNVVLKGSNEGVVTNSEGKFEFSRKLNTDDVLIFSYIGYSSQEYIVVDDAYKNMNVNIIFDPSDIALLGALKVDGTYSSKRNIFQKFIDLFR